MALSQHLLNIFVLCLSGISFHVANISTTHYVAKRVRHVTSLVASLPAAAAAAAASAWCLAASGSRLAVRCGVMKQDDMTVELRYDAPLATFDGDEWREFLDDDDDDDDDVTGRAHSVLYADTSDRRAGTESADCDAGGFADGVFSGSLEDLVSCFDDNVRHCFRNYSRDTQHIAPVQLRTHEQVLHESQSVYRTAASVCLTPHSLGGCMVCPCPTSVGVGRHVASPRDTTLLHVVITLTNGRRRITVGMRSVSSTDSRVGTTSDE